MHAPREGEGLRHSSPGFVAAVLVTLAAAGFSGLMVSLMLLEVDLPGAFGQMTHFQEPHHRIHDLTFGFLFVPPVVGMFVQLRYPARNIAGMLMALVPAVGLLLTVVLTLVVAGDTRMLQPPWIIVGAPALIALSLHPAGRDFFRSFRVTRVSPVMLGLVIVAAFPLLGFATTNIDLQGAVGGDHAAAGHYGFMAAFGFTVIGVGVLASLRPDGWRITAWVAGLLPALLGASSLLYPNVSSSPQPAWALSAIAWGVVFVVAAEIARNAPRLLLSSPGDRPPPVPSPR